MGNIPPSGKGGANRSKASRISMSCSRELNWVSWATNSEFCIGSSGFWLLTWAIKRRRKSDLPSCGPDLAGSVPPIKSETD